MKLRKLGKALLFPHIAIMIILLPIATVFLVYSMVALESDSVTAIISYVIAFYTLSIWCARIPNIIKFFKSFKNENKYALKWQADARLRVNVSLYGTLILNIAYALFQLGLGYLHKTFWFYSLAGYYIFLAIMRFFLACHTRKYRPGEKMKAELIKYRACGMIFLLMNLALSLIIFFMVYWNRTFVHHEITTIAMAAYTFTAFTLAIIGIIKYRKYNSPVYSASKAISLAAASVSMLTLESTMLTTFGDSMTPISSKLFLGLTGGAVSLFILIMSVYMIVQSGKRLKTLKQQTEVKN